MFEEKEIIKILSKALNTKLSSKSNDKNVKMGLLASYKF